jgi:antitoxin component YwqK of YwqJK toxin-antitoxin module
MKTIISIITLFFYFSSFFSSAQSDNLNKTDATGKKQGHWIKLDDDRKKMYEGSFVEGIPVGKFTYFYDTGTPWSVTFFSNNGKISHTQMFDAAGKLTAEGKYVNEKKDSLWKFYSKSGKLISTENYINGIKNGTFKVFYENGELLEEQNWKNGVQEGVSAKYFDSGQLKYQRNYINNKVEGKATYYYPSGKVNIEGVYKNDLKEGHWKYYKENGTLERTDEYVNGLFVGKKDPNVISKEVEEKERKLSEQFEIKDPYGDR